MRVWWYSLYAGVDDGADGSRRCAVPAGEEEARLADLPLAGVSEVKALAAGSGAGRVCEGRQAPVGALPKLPRII
jgi:hypothetical protein